MVQPYNGILTTIQLVGGVTLPNFKAYYKSIVIKTVVIV